MLLEWIINIYLAEGKRIERRIATAKYTIVYNSIKHTFANVCVDDFWLYRDCGARGKNIFFVAKLDFFFMCSISHSLIPLFEMIQDVVWYIHSKNFIELSKLCRKWIDSYFLIERAIDKQAFTALECSYSMQTLVFEGAVGA